MTILLIGVAVLVSAWLLPGRAARRLQRVLRRPGSVRPGSVRPGLGRPGSPRPGAARRNGRVGRSGRAGLDPDGRQDDGARADFEPALVLDLVAVALRGGLDSRSSIAAVGRSLGCATETDADIDTQLAGIAERLGGDAREAVGEVRTAMTFADTTGAPAANLLLSRADDLRRRSARRAEEAAGRLAVKVVVPLGVCILPAFIALGVMPVVLSLVGQLGDVY